MRLFTIKAGSFMISLSTRNVFLLDCIGAGVTAVLMLIFSIFFEDVLGIQSNHFLLLSLIATIYVFYSFICFKLVRTITSNMLLLIMLGNLMHCLLIVPVICYINDTTSLAYVYFFLEASVVGILVLIEREAYKRIS